MSKTTAFRVGRILCESVDDVMVDCKTVVVWNEDIKDVVLLPPMAVNENDLEKQEYRTETSIPVRLCIMNGIGKSEQRNAGTAAASKS
jgi:hypothetical protein